MRYKLKFVEAVNWQALIYKAELLALMEKHSMPMEDKQVIIDTPRYRWYPCEVFATLEAPR